MHELAQIGVTFRPIHAWPRGGATTKPSARRSPFKQTLADTARILASELRQLRAKPGAILEIDLRENDIRLDGMPRADARVGHPGVILTFECKHGTLRLFTDACHTWQHNLRAIAMHLEHLRMSSLYGVGRGGEQYRGWKALPADAASAEELDLNSAAAIVGEAVVLPAGTLLADRLAVQRAFRDVALQHHPDQGGNEEEFKRLMAACAVLKKHHGIA